LARSETRIVPAIAVPKEEPRFETLRDRPEISACSSSGKADCTMFTDGVSITPIPRPISSRPGASANALEDASPTSPISRPVPRAQATKPATIRSFWGRRLARRSAASEDTSTPAVADVKITPVLIAL
jgi:hypothetical protein